MTGSIRVLHVDDEPDFADMAATFLEREDERIRVETATDAREGLERLEERDFDCVVSDYDMPRVNGLEFLEAIREKWPDLPFVLFTGKGDEAVASDAISAGVTDYLQKGNGTEQYRLLAQRVVDAVEHRYAEANYREVFEKIPDGIAVQDPNDGSFLDVNATFAELFGYDRDELLAAGFETIHVGEEPHTLADARRHVREAFDHGPQTFEWPAVTNGGTRFWAEVHLTPARLHGAERVLAVVRDVTDRKEREEELERYETLVEVSGDPMYMLDDGGHFTYVNDRYVEITGYSRETLLGRHVRLVMDEEHVERGTQLIRSLLSSGERRGTFEFDLVTADGDRIPMENHITIRYADGEFRGTLGVHRDITERRERARQLQRERDRLDEFAGVVSHDLKNPLTVAEGRLELAAEECESEHLESAQAALGRMGTLIDDILSLARSGETVGDTVPVDLAAVTDACWSVVESASASLDVETERTVLADRTRLQSLLENLLSNAVSHGGGDVEITVGDLPDGFYVEDDGPGIPEAERQHILDFGYSTSDDGTGLGLSIVRNVADAHGWDLEITSGPGGGARFEITGVEEA